jgi:nucleoside-diphosphate-sugar epimerase
MEDIDIVIHAASASPAFSEEKIQNIVVGGTQTLLESAVENRVKRFVYVSSTAVYGIPKSVPMLEESEIQPYHDPYNRSKAKAEAICLSYRERGLCVPILRPRTFLGPQRLGTFAMLFEWANEGRHFPMLGDGSNLYQFLDVYDLCEAIRLSVEAPRENANDTFNIGAKEFTTMKETYQVVLDKAGFGKRIVSIPVTPALIILNILSALKLSPLYKRLYQKIFMDYYASIDKAEQQLGFKPRYSNIDTLLRCYQWYCEEYARTEPSEQGQGNNAPWNQGVLKLGKVFF